MAPCVEISVLDTVIGSGPANRPKVPRSTCRRRSASAVYLLLF